MGKRCLALTLAAALLPSAGVADCAPDRVDLRGDWGAAVFRAEVADDPDERNLGLMFRDSLPVFSGMLFVYESPRPVSFWMRNTRIPLDMIFADARGIVRKVHENAVPEDLTPIPGGDDIQFVFEVNGGLSRKLGIGPGSQLRHPAIGPGAAWPCDGAAQN